MQSARAKQPTAFPRLSGWQQLQRLGRASNKLFIKGSHHGRHRPDALRRASSASRMYKKSEKKRKDQACVV